MTTFKHHITVGKQMYAVQGDTLVLNKDKGNIVVTYTSIKLLGGYKELVDTIPEDVLGYIDIVVRERIGEEL